MSQRWDYLILTASNEQQADAYRQNLAVRQQLGLLGDVNECLVVPDPGGRRVGSGGSTLACLTEVVRRQRKARAGASAEELLAGLRVLILHAGGDSRRLPAYGPCGKLFVPLPVRSESALPATLFDRQLPVYLALPRNTSDSGQIVIAAGDVLLDFAASEVSFCGGLSGLACPAAPAQAANHGVFVTGRGQQLRCFLQKPSVAEQTARGAVDQYGQSYLDIGVFQFDAPTAGRLLSLFGASESANWSGGLGNAIERHGLDFYREIACALGIECTWEDYLAAVRGSGSAWTESDLRAVFDAVSPLPARVQVLPRCEFLHFGTTEEILQSGAEVRRREETFAPPGACLTINNRMGEDGRLTGTRSWVEACRIDAPLHLAGGNVVVGVDVCASADLPPGACIDVLPGRRRDGTHGYFFRFYHAGDPLHRAYAPDAALCGLPLMQWLRAAGGCIDDLWDPALPHDRRSMWNAALFPTSDDSHDYCQWMWMLSPQKASADRFRYWWNAERYSLAAMATAADQDAFFARRVRLHGDAVRRDLKRALRADSPLSATDLAWLVGQSDAAGQWLAELTRETRRQASEADRHDAGQVFGSCRVLHSLGSVVGDLPGNASESLWQRWPEWQSALAADDRSWLTEQGLDLTAPADVWARNASKAAFAGLRKAIVASGEPVAELPQAALRSDEIVWGRAPARLDLTGGWTDTPPYALERGGAVLNAAVFLNGQPPIQAFARVTEQPFIRLRSIDQGTQLDVGQWEDLLDYASAVSDFSLVKAALVHAGVHPECGGPSLAEALARVGGGLEVTTLAAIPKGSGLGTSSIMGAVLTAVVNRVMGRTLSPAELFHSVLRLEQALTTGGGWQDQIGGSTGGLKLITTRPGLVPDASIRYVPADCLEPSSNHGCTLLYYTGVTRLAKNILQEVVGRYLNRDREAIRTLAALHGLAGEMADTMARKDYVAFGRQIDEAWRLNNRLDPNSTNASVEAILDAVRPHLIGAKLLGAGGGGFLLMVCRSPEDARQARLTLEAQPPNARARFFRFDVSLHGLEVSCC